MRLSRIAKGFLPQYLQVLPGLNVSNFVVPHWKLSLPGSFHYMSRVSPSFSYLFFGDVSHLR